MELVSEDISVSRILHFVLRYGAARCMNTGAEQRIKDQVWSKCFGYNVSTLLVFYCVLIIVVNESSRKCRKKSTAFLEWWKVSLVQSLCKI